MTCRLKPPNLASRGNILDAILPAIDLISSALITFHAFPYAPGFDARAVSNQAQILPSYSWEFGTAAETLLELYNPGLSVFGSSPFPVPAVNYSTIPALNYAAQKVDWGTGYSALANGDGATGDPASLGVSAVMIGKTNSTFAWAADQTATGLLEDVPRFANGAISHRSDVAELWADFMYMAPPFLAYYAVNQGNTTLLQETVEQCTLYRQVLKANRTDAMNGLWMHIIGPQNQDTGFWSTGNGWAAAGMTRVLATVIKATSMANESWRQQAITLLTGYIKEIIDGAMAAPQDGGLLRNYLDDTSDDGLGFGEISGSSLLASVVYRMAVLQPNIFSPNSSSSRSSGTSYIAWADSLRQTVSGNDGNGNPHINANGIVTPAVNPLWWKDTNPDTSGSPEGQNFVVLMYTAWRDCVKAGVCSSPNATATGSSRSRAIKKRSTRALKRHNGLRRALTRLILGKGG
ncbi:hypothetical protein CVT26_004063 [Gymnopilus dilepis]|uniref:Uncharacterized protein n=1 Tax=Gymnopilus dilepis TaxID=231916 RepID=A0A409YMG9_9AGAR|nr:hypothetical protein CVT26_004063 [Gymnopilus dilepis]